MKCGHFEDRAGFDLLTSREMGPRLVDTVRRVIIIEAFCK